MKPEIRAVHPKIFEYINNIYIPGIYYENSSKLTRYQVYSLFSLSLGPIYALQQRKQTVEYNRYTHPPSRFSSESYPKLHISGRLLQTFLGFNSASSISVRACGGNPRSSKADALLSSMLWLCTVNTAVGPSDAAAANTMTPRVPPWTTERCARESYALIILRTWTQASGGVTHNGGLRRIGFFAHTKVSDNT